MIDMTVLTASARFHTREDVMSKSLGRRRFLTRSVATSTAGPLQRASNGEDEVRTTVEAPLEQSPGEPLRLRVFRDKPLLEVFANDRQCITQVIYPKDKAATGVKVITAGGAARLVSGEVWDMAAARFTDARGEDGAA